MLESRDRVVGHLVFLDGLRGLACLWVVCNHLKLDALVDVLPGPLHEWLVVRGGLGVLVFFVVSGFVITNSLLPVRLGGPAVGNFVLRRFVRLSPPYYVSLIVAVVVSSVAAAVKGEWYAAPGSWSWIAHLAYVPHLLDVPLINGVHWTLYLEMQFYLVFVGALWCLQAMSRRGSQWWGVGVVVLALSALLWPVAGWSMATRPVFAAYWFAFVSGVLVCWWSRSIIPAWLCGGYHVVLAAAWLVSGEQMIGAAVVTGSLVAVATAAERMGTWLNGRRVQFLGAVSYSLYLIHAPVIGVVDWARGLLLGDSAAAEAIGAVAAVGCSVVAAWVLWWSVEQPAIAWSRGLRRVPVARAAGGADPVRRRTE